MEKPSKSVYTKRTRKDYSLSLKLQIVKEVESGESTISICCKRYGIQSRSTVLNWLRKYGNFDWENKDVTPFKKHLNNVLWN
ncbi:transposase [Chryseobacterium rhizoplanae]|uniref:transposase n=1 Tax=Chryseobacterium rhizoplanae TaxID=1609531 RepID=UPI001CE2913C|nr:transposase [Chryseobacterium rhizoplanae]